MRNTSAYREGYEAYYIELYAPNPYPEGSQAALDWEEGFDEALHDDCPEATEHW